jgi:hypothetical protein
VATRWVSVVPLQSRPFDSGPSATGLAVATVNVLVTKRPSETFLREAAQVLLTAGVVALSPVSTLRLSSEANLPSKEACVVLKASGGPSGLRTHNRAGTTYERATLQVNGYAPDYEAAEHICWLALKALEPVENADVAPAAFA